MIKHFAKRLLLPVSVALAVASCQQPSATTSPSPSVAASASPSAKPTETASASPKASESPKADASPKASESPKVDASPKADAPKADAAGLSPDKVKDVDTFIKENGDFKEMYTATGGDKYVTLVATETCKALDSGVPFPTLIDALEKEFDKQGSSNSIPADKLTKLKEYTGFVVGGSIAIACPQHKDKIKT